MNLLTPDIETLTYMTLVSVAVESPQASCIKRKVVEASELLCTCVSLGGIEVLANLKQLIPPNYLKQQATSI